MSFLGVLSGLSGAEVNRHSYQHEIGGLLILKQELEMSGDRQIEVRRQRARNELRRYRITNIQPGQFLSLYKVRSGSGNTYDVEICNPFELENRCSCPDYETNGLGTCKHIEAVLIHLQREYPAEFKRQRTILAGEKVKKVHVTLAYDEAFCPHARFDKLLADDLKAVVGRYFNEQGSLRAFAGESYGELAAHTREALDDLQREMTAEGGVVTIASEVTEYIAELERKGELEQEKERWMGQIERGERRLDLLRLPLYPYQTLGTLFLTFTERALLGDEMGLGKTVQAIAAAVFLKGQGHVSKVLIICPASLKLQWAKEIRRFSHETVTVIGGTKKKRLKQYEEDSFFTVLNYELVLRDKDLIAGLGADLTILDEVQRIKNWRAKTTQYIKDLPCTYAYVLTGTPLENKLEELYSIVQFLDRRLLGPAWQFIQRHVVKDEWGAIVGYRELDVVKRKVAPIFLRRRKREVLPDLPARIDNTYYLELERGQEQLYRPLERELRELLRRPAEGEEWDQEEIARALGLMVQMREICDAAQLVDEGVHASSKLTELRSLVEDITVYGGCKTLVFSQWERMTRLVEAELSDLPISMVRMHGGLSTRQRQAIIECFSEDPDCRAFISTDAGGLGLNLQAADYVVNVDLPWNPAVVEQRIGRVHRIGQRNVVNVINLVVTDTIEERVQEVLYDKQSLFDTMFETDIAEISLTAVSRVDRLQALVAELLGEEAETPAVKARGKARAKR